jgi:shikimate dehydrogenase
LAVARKDVAGVGAALLFNATPVGMHPHTSQMVVSKKEISSFRAIADVVNNPVKTALIRSAERMGKIAIPGYKMSIYQGLAQFGLYTGRKASISMVEKKMLSLLSKK